MKGVGVGVRLALEVVVPRAVLFDFGHANRRVAIVPAPTATAASSPAVTAASAIATSATTTLAIAAATSAASIPILQSC
jgi:hypothetical protein